MDADDPIWGNRVTKLSEHRGGAEKALVLRPAKLPDPAKIPPRQWLYGTQLLRGFVTVLVAPGGTGKSAYAMAVAVALAAGEPLLNEHIFARVNCAVLNLEDPMDELDRRLAALTIRHKVDETDLADRLFLHSGEDRAVTMAAMGDDGFQVVHPDEEALVAEIKAHDIGVIIVDPFAESHTLEENSNPHMVAAAAAWRRVARATDCAVMLVHHVRKGAVTDIDSARGAKGLTDSARVGLLLSPMTEDEGEMIGIPAEERWQYVRLDNAKANMAPRASKAKWFRLDQVELHNGTDAYPNGDRVAAVVGWEPPNSLSAQPVSTLNAALDRIAEGPSPGVLYGKTRRGGSDRWAGTVLFEMCEFNDKQAANVIATWLKTGLLYEETFRDPRNRKETSGLRVNDSKRPSE